MAGEECLPVAPLPRQLFVAELRHQCRPQGGALDGAGEDHRGAALPPLQAFRGVRIETRGPAASRRVAASDGLHEAVLWEEHDSRGTRQFAWVQSTWNNEEKLFEEVLPAGLWSIEARWLANDRVEFAVQTATPDAPLPVAPTRVGGITVEVVRR